MRLRFLVSGLHYLEKRLSWISGLALVLLLIMMIIQILFRLSNVPISGVIDMTEQYLMPMLVFFAISYEQAAKGHIRVEFLYDRLPVAAKNVIDVFVALIGTIVTGLLTYGAYEEMFYSIQSGYETSGDIKFPLYTALLIPVIGFGALALRYLCELIEAGWALFSAGSHPEGLQ